jgi:exosome complex RNA-binding protein Rrp4
LKSLAIFILSIVSMGTMVSAPGNNDHVRGVVTQISATSVTVQVSGQTTKTLTLSEKTTFEKSGRAAQLNDLKVGDRVVIDVPKGSTDASLIRFGPPPPKKAS